MLIFQVLPLYGLYAQCRCAAVKIKYIPHHQNDGSSIVLWKPMYYKYDVDGHETTFYGASLNSYMTTGGVKYKNLERPWGIYKKSIKYRKFTKIPCPEIGDPTTANQNIAGMWHGVGDAIAVTENAYGTHLICWMDDNTQSFLHGTIFVTAYMVYKDRLINSRNVAGQYYPPLPCPSPLQLNASDLRSDLFVLTQL